MLFWTCDALMCVLGYRHGEVEMMSQAFSRKRIAANHF